MEYRLLKKEDVEQIFLLGRDDFGSKEEYSWDWCVIKIKQYLKKPFGFGIVCVENDFVAGFVLVEKNYSSQKPNVAWLTYIFVDEKYRHKSIGRSLLNRVFLELNKLGKTDLITDVYLKNQKSVKFFELNKFEIREKWLILSKKI